MLDNVEKSVVATFYQVAWIDCTLQDRLDQKSWQYNIQKMKTLQWKSEFEIHRPASDLS